MATSSLGITLKHQRILQIYRWYIHLSIGTDRQRPFNDGKLDLPSVPSLPMNKVFDFEGYLIALEFNLIHQRKSRIYRSCIHLSIGTDGQSLFTDSKLTLPLVPTVPMNKIFSVG